MVRACGRVSVRTRACVCVCVRARVRACVRLCVYMRACASECVRVLQPMSPGCTGCNVLSDTEQGWKSNTDTTTTNNKKANVQLTRNQNQK